MKLNENQIAKIDPLLQQVLIDAKGNEVIRAVMRLGDENKIRLNVSNSPLEPQQFTSSEAYRQALIEQRKSQLAQMLGDTIQKLQKLSLKPVGGELSRVVVVEGSADAILRSLSLSGVNYVTLDRLIALPEVAPDATVKHFADIYINTLDCSLDDKIIKLIYQASEQYIINYYRRHNKLQILGMQQPVDLDSIYTSVQCLQESDIWRWQISLQDLEKNPRATNRRFQTKGVDKREGIKVVNEQQYLMVLGAPGAGKSTFLRKIGLEAFKGKYGELQHECIPVFIELKLVNESKINIKELIIEAFRLCQLPLSRKFTINALKQGKLLILLDGLDEIPAENTDLAINEIKSFVEEYKENRFLISCRTAAYRSQLRNLIEIGWFAVVIADFDDAQIQQFIQNWFSSEVDKRARTADKCWDLIKSQESTKELSRTPVLLTFLCLVYDASQNLPKNRATLYSKALDILLEKWAAEKRSQTKPIYYQFGIDLEKMMLTEIAYHSFKLQRLFLSHQEIVSQIKNFLQNNHNAPKDLDAEAVLDAIAIQQGILVERARDIYSFSHLTLQEYLTAQYIDDHHQVKKLVTEHLTDETWNEVFLLVAGLMRGGADDLLLSMEKETQKYLNTPKLQALLNWAEQVTLGSTGNLKGVGKRASAIAYAYAILNTYSIAHGLANGIGYSYAQAYGYARIYANASAIANIYTDSPFGSYPKIYDIANAYTNANVTTISLASAIYNTNSIKDAIANTISHFRYLKKLNIFRSINLTELIEKLQSQIPTELNSDQNSIEDHRAFVQENCQYLIEKFTEECLKAFNLTTDKVNDVDEVEDKSLAKTKDRFSKPTLAYAGNYTSSFNSGNPRNKLAEQDRAPSPLHLPPKQNSSDQSATPINLSLEEIKALENYLYVNYLIIQCKQAAVRVLPQTWEVIEARMLLVPNG